MNFLKKIFMQRSKIFISWILSYAIILLVPIVIGFYVYHRSIDAINKEVSRAHTATLEQFRTVMDGRFEELTMLGSFITGNREVQRLMQTSNELTSEDRVNIFNAQNELAKFQRSKNYLSGLFIYTKRNNTLFTSTFKYRKEDIPNVILDFTGLDTEKFGSLTAERQFRNVWIHNDTIIFAQSLYLHDWSVPEGLFIAVFDRVWLKNILDTMNWVRESGAKISDAEARFVQSRGDFAFSETLDQKVYFSRVGTFYLASEGQQLAVTNLPSALTNLRYISVIPSRLYHRSARDIQTIILLYVLVYLLIGSGLSILFAKRNFDPLKKLTKMLVEKIGRSSDKEGNEFGYLEESLNKLLSRNTSLVESLNMQSDNARNDFFIKLIKGRVKSIEKIDEMKDMLGIGFISEKFLVAAFSIDSLGKETFGENAKMDDHTINLVNFILRNITEEVFKTNGHICFVATTEATSLCLVNIDLNKGTDKNNVFDEIMRVFQNVIQILEEKFEVVASLTVSGIKNDYAGIALGYAEVVEMKEFKVFFDIPEKIMTPDLIELMDKNEYDYNSTLDKERQFLNCVYAKDYANAKEILNDIISNEIEGNFQSLKHSRCKMFGLLNLMLNAMGEIKTRTDIEFFEKLDPVNVLISTNSVKQLKTRVNSLFDTITEYSLIKEKQMEPAWLKEAERLIDQNYANNDFSIGDIAEKLGMSVSYLSRSYKKLRAIGLLDYLHKVRLVEAKKLLEGECNIKDAAESVGYLDSKALIRAFKRYEGITPGKYKDVIL